MSAASLRVIRGMVERGTADLALIDAWQGRKLLTGAEADDARAYWHTLYDPPPTPEPTPAPEPIPAPSEPGSGTQDGSQGQTTEGA